MEEQHVKSRRMWLTWFRGVGRGSFWPSADRHTSNGRRDSQEPRAKSQEPRAKSQEPIQPLDDLKSKHPVPGRLAQLVRAPGQQEFWQHLPSCWFSWYLVGSVVSWFAFFFQLLPFHWHQIGTDWTLSILCRPIPDRFSNEERSERNRTAGMHVWNAMFRAVSWHSSGRSIAARDWHIHKPEISLSASIFSFLPRSYAHVRNFTNETRKPPVGRFRKRALALTASSRSL